MDGFLPISLPDLHYRKVNFVTMKLWRDNYIYEGEPPHISFTNIKREADGKWCYSSPEFGIQRVRFSNMYEIALEAAYKRWLCDAILEEHTWLMTSESSHPRDNDVDTPF